MSAVLNFIRLQDLIDQNALQGKRVFIRADLNVPQDDAGNITEDTRIRASVPAIRAAAAAGAKVMVTSHLGRPTEGEFKPEDSLAPVAARLSKLLGQPVELKQNWVDGARLSSALNSPSVGRPRWDVTMTLAPAAAAARMAGTEARMRVSSVILPASSCGTFKSARMNTRLPCRAFWSIRSCRRMKFKTADMATHWLSDKKALFYRKASVI